MTNLLILTQSVEALYFFLYPYINIGKEGQAEYIIYKQKNTNTKHMTITNTKQHTNYHGK
jgi:hypothetical protein